MTQAALVELEERIRALGPWFHDLEIHGIRTAPEHPLGTVIVTAFDGGLDSASFVARSARV